MTSNADGINSARGMTDCEGQRMLYDELSKRFRHVLSVFEHFEWVKPRRIRSHFCDVLGNCASDDLRMGIPWTSTPRRYYTSNPWFENC